MRHYTPLDETSEGGYLENIQYISSIRANQAAITKDDGETPLIKTPIFYRCRCL